jgi:hypothetical protein
MLPYWLATWISGLLVGGSFVGFAESDRLGIWALWAGVGAVLGAVLWLLLDRWLDR